MNVGKGTVGFLLSLVLIISWSDCWAGPFGFEHGMTKDEITTLVGRQSLVKIVNGNIYEFSTAPRPYEAFEFYLLMISPEKGLVKVWAISRDVDTGTDGEQLKKKFQEIQTFVSETYGKGETYDSLKAGSIWSAPKDWMLGLLKEERSLACTWMLTIRKDDITAIRLDTGALSPEKGYVSLGYAFEGFAEYIEAADLKGAFLAGQWSEPAAQSPHDK